MTPIIRAIQNAIHGHDRHAGVERIRCSCEMKAEDICVALGLDPAMTVDELRRAITLGSPIEKSDLWIPWTDEGDDE